MILGWKHFAIEVAKLASKVQESGFNPELIVAVARGGLIPARYLSSLLKIKQLACIGMRYTDAQRTVLETYSAPNLTPTPSRILLVEDMLESGKSLASAKSVLEKNGAEVRTAALYFRDHSVLEPDFSIRSSAEPIEFPWETDIKTLT